MPAYLPEYSTVKLLVLPESTSALDRWSDRAIRLANVQWVFAAAVTTAYSIDLDPRTETIHYEHPKMPRRKMLAAVLTVLLPMASFVPRLLAWLRSFRTLRSPRMKDAASKIPIKPLYFCVFQLLQLMTCSLLTSYDFVTFSAGLPIFWISLVCWFIPAFAGFAYALVGVGRFCFAKSVQRSFRRYHATSEEYSDGIVEHGPLEQAYQLQQAVEELSPEIPAALWREGNTQVVNEARSQSCQNQDLGIPQVEELHQGFKPEQERGITRQQVRSSEAQNEQEPTTQPLSASSPPRVRFRWQEASGARNGGAQFWSPAIAASVLSTFCIRYSSYTLHYTYGITPEMRRYCHILITICNEGVAELLQAYSTHHNCVLRHLVSVDYTHDLATLQASICSHLYIVLSSKCDVHRMVPGVR